MATVYYLFDAQKKEQQGPYEESEFDALVLAIPKTELINKFVWTTGWSNWKPAVDYISTLKKGSELILDAETGLAEVTKIQSLQSAYNEQRRHPRFQYRLECIIRNRDADFRTFTHDISMGGVQLQEPVPAHMLNHKCQIQLKSPDGGDELIFTLNLTKRSEPKYFFFTDFEPDDLLKLETWLIQLSKKEIKRPKLKI